jgi:hypothetical protein
MGGEYLTPNVETLENAQLEGVGGVGTGLGAVGLFITWGCVLSWDANILRLTRVASDGYKNP